MAYIGNSPGVASQRVVTQFTATSNQTTFIPTSGYTIGYLDVFLNGVKLVSGDDYTASNGTTVVLAEGAAADDSVEVVSFIPRGLSDGWLKSEADTRYLQLGASFSGDVSGTYSAITLANSGVTAGSYGSATNIPAITVDSKGRITSVTNTAVSIPSGSLTFTGDVTGSGSTGSSTSLTLANSGVTAGSYGSASAIPQITVDSKGRVTSISTTAVTVPTTLTVAASSGLTENINLSTGQLLLEAGTGVSTSTGAGKVTIAIGQAVSTTSNVSFNNLTLAGELRGPSTLIIDPAAVGDDTGTVRVRGNLQVDGTTTTVNSTTLEVADLNITLAKNAINAGAADGAGITVAGASANLIYAAATDSWSFNKNLGIGTSSPGVRLDVNGAMRSNSITISNTASNSILTMNPGTALYSIIAMTGASNNAALGLDILAGQGNAWFSADTHYFRNAAQTTNYVVINSTGVGVGMSPTNKLTIKPSTTSSAVFDVLTGSTNADSIRLNVGGTVNTWLELRGYLGIKLYSDQTNVLTVNSSGHTLPGTDNSYDLGSFTARWRNIYTADMHFSNYGSQNSVDGTWGNWTLQEGEENIYMLNNRTGRKYKIVLEEV